MYGANDEEPFRQKPTNEQEVRSEYFVNENHEKADVRQFIKDTEAIRQKQEKLTVKETFDYYYKYGAMPPRESTDTSDRELRLLAVQKTNSLEEAEKVFRWLKGEKQLNNEI